jgi:hypothetical protein
VWEGGRSPTHTPPSFPTYQLVCVMATPNRPVAGSSSSSTPLLINASSIRSRTDARGSLVPASNRLTTIA